MWERNPEQPIERNYRSLPRGYRCSWDSAVIDCREYRKSAVFACDRPSLDIILDGHTTGSGETTGSGTEGGGSDKDTVVNRDSTLKRLSKLIKRDDDVTHQNENVTRDIPAECRMDYEALVSSIVADIERSKVQLDPVSTSVIVAPSNVLYPKVLFANRTSCLILFFSFFRFCLTF